MYIIKKTFALLFVIALLVTGFILSTERKVLAADNIALGAQGQEVEQLQAALNSKDYWCGEANGLFGPRTYNALIRFQKDHKLTVNGQIDEALKKALDMLPPLSNSSESQESATVPPTAVADKSKAKSSPTVSRGGGRVITMVATGYTDAPEENWPYAGAPSYIGLPLARGIVAVDPRVIPMGSKLYVEGYGEAIAADQGGAIKGNRIDLFFDSKAEAHNWGMRSVKVTVY